MTVTANRKAALEFKHRLEEITTVPDVRIFGSQAGELEYWHVTA